MDEACGSLIKRWRKQRTQCRSSNLGRLGPLWVALHMTFSCRDAESGLCSSRALSNNTVGRCLRAGSLNLPIENPFKAVVNL